MNAYNTKLLKLANDLHTDILSDKYISSDVFKSKIGYLIGFIQALEIVDSSTEDIVPGITAINPVTDPVFNLKPIKRGRPAKLKVGDKVIIIECISGDAEHEGVVGEIENIDKIHKTYDIKGNNGFGCAALKVKKV
jgi:hypothetical protein